MIIDKAYPLSIAPMMDCTDRHFRFFMRQITRQTLLYTEMVVAQSIHHANRENRLQKILEFHPLERPLVIQLGGSDPDSLVEAAKICEDHGFDGINLNVGCPSTRVQSGRFGACLMKEPHHVAECVHKMSTAVSIPVSVKHRLGVDDLDDYEHLHDFVKIVSGTGIQHFIVHARKAWLKGLSPAQNRTRPPLNYENVYQLKRDFPGLNIEVNGGVKTLEEVFSHLTRVDGVMIGRAAYDNPWIFSAADTALFNCPKNPTQNRFEVLRAMVPYLQTAKNSGLRFHGILRHMMGLFHGEPGARVWRRWINEELQRKEQEPEFLIRSLDCFQELQVLNSC
jgi:tRNA-dihydrouridine synthase A